MSAQTKRPGLIMDISRLLSRMAEMTPTGIDRIELRYAQWAATTETFDVAFVRQVGNRFDIVPSSLARRIVDHCMQTWSGARRAASPLPVLPDNNKDDALPQLPGSLVQLIRRASTTFYLNVSHYGIDREALYLELHMKWRVRFAFYIHDMLPMQFPEYVKAQDATTHEKRLRSVLQLGSIVLTNSRATATALEDWARGAGFGSIDCHVLTIGLEPQFMDAPTGVGSSAAGGRGGRPYFLMVGTIEPRKNHTLVLNIWRRMCERDGADAVPQIEIVGKRGWESGHVFSFIERCARIKGAVTERAAIEDHELRETMRGARALLFPSFGEGWGMPLIEAIAMRVPVICSDLPVFREAAQNTADYLDPLDAPAWERAILDYADPASERRSRQLDRQSGVALPSWDTHFAALDRLLRDRSRQRVAVTPAVPDTGRLRLTAKVDFAPDPSAERHEARGGNLFSALVEQADMYRDARDWHGAASFYRAALQNDPSNAGIWVQLGHMLKEYGDYHRAFEAYAQAFVLMPADTDLHIQAGHLLKVAGRKDEANRYYRLAHELDPDSDALAHVVV